MADDTPDEDDVEAEMMRMMQEELSGDDSSETDQDDDLAQMATALGGSEDAGNIDEMLEQEMLKAMQTESGGSSEGSPDQLAAYGEATQASETPEGIERLAGIDVNVTVELGSASVEIRDIMKWTSDSSLNSRHKKVTWLTSWSMASYSPEEKLWWWPIPLAFVFWSL
jgi:flagellar motor switch/type III secretory pathway protein FliN